MEFDFTNKKKRGQYRTAAEEDVSGAVGAVGDEGAVGTIEL